MNRKFDKNGRLIESIITFEKSLWFKLEIKIRGSVGGIIGNWIWAKQNLKLLSKNDSSRNNYYDCTGEIQVSWELKEWSIGHPDIDLYRKWLAAISESLQNHFDWNQKINTMHIEAQYITD